MKVSRCRFWKCSKCQAIFEKQDLAIKVWAYAGQVTFLGNATCGKCQAPHAWSDVYAGTHDVPRQQWRQLPQPVELPAEDPAAESATARTLEGAGNLLARLFPKSCPTCHRMRMPKDYAFYCEKCGTTMWGPTIAWLVVFGGLIVVGLTGLAVSTSFGWQIGFGILAGFCSFLVLVFLGRFLFAARLAWQYRREHPGRKR